MSDMAIATAGLAMQQASRGNDAAMLMLKQVIQQEQAVLQLVQTALQPASNPSQPHHVGNTVDIVV